MKLTKSLFIGGALVSALTLGAATTYADDMEWEGEENLTEEAKEAVEVAKKEFNGQVTEVEYDEDDGQKYYEIKLEKGDDDVDIKVNANDLSIMEKDSDFDDNADDREDDSDDRDDAAENDNDDDRDDADDREDDSDDRNESTENDDDDDDKENTAKAASKNDDKKEAKNAVELDKAFDKQTTKAIDKALDNFDGVLESVSYEEDDGQYEYQVNLVNKDEEYEVTFNAKDLKVIEEETDDDSDDFKRLEKAQDVKVISFKEAKELAESKAKGKIDEWDYDVDDFHYDFEVGDKEVTINAKTGEVIEIED